MLRPFSPRLILSVLSVALVAVTAGAQARPPIGSIERLDPAMDALVPRSAVIELLADGFIWTEGPVWRKSGGYLLFSDIPSNAVMKWKEGQGISVFMRPAGYSGATPPGRELGTNGLAFDANDKLVVADHGNRQIARVNDSVFTRVPLADKFEGKRLNSPNDLVFHPNGDIYFTDPPYGLNGTNTSPLKEQAFNAVYRLKPSGELTQVITSLTYPNGVALSPDSRTLYVAVSDGRRPVVMAYDVQPDGSVARERVFFDAAPLAAQRRVGSPDGLKVDRNGNLFATGPGGVLALNSAGKHLGTIMTGERTANVAFGDDGSTLYMTADHKLMRIKLTTKGLGF